MWRNDERWPSTELRARRQETQLKDHRKQETTKDELYKSLTVSAYEVLEVVRGRGANAYWKKNILADLNWRQMKLRSIALTVSRRRVEGVELGCICSFALKGQSQASDLKLKWSVALRQFPPQYAMKLAGVPNKNNTTCVHTLPSFPAVLCFMCVDFL